MVGPSAQLALFPDTNLVCARSCWCGRVGRAGACPGGDVPGLLQPSDPDFDVRLAETDGLDISNTRARPQPPLLLPAFLPQVDGSAVVSTTRRPVVVITLAALAKRCGVQLRNARPLRERLGLAPGVRVGVLLTGPDSLLEDLWARRSAWLDALAVLRPGFTIGPTFSVWTDDYALEGLYAIRRSVYFYGLLQDRGIQSVVSVYWRDHDDIARWHRWLRQNPVEAIAMDLQCVGTGGFPRFLRELGNLRDGVRRPLRLIVNGLLPGRRLAEVTKVWPDVTVTANLCVLAGSRHTRVQRFDGSHVRASTNTPRPTSRVRGGDRRAMADPADRAPDGGLRRLRIFADRPTRPDRVSYAANPCSTLLPRAPRTVARPSPGSSPISDGSRRPSAARPRRPATSGASRRIGGLTARRPGVRGASRRVQRGRRHAGRQSMSASARRSGPTYGSCTSFKGPVGLSGGSSGATGYRVAQAYLAYQGAVPGTSASARWRENTQTGSSGP